MKFFNVYLVFSYLFILFSEINGAHDAWITLPSDTYSSNSKTLSIVVNPRALRLIDSGKSLDIPIQMLLAGYPAMYDEFQTNISKLKNPFANPKLRGWQLVVHDTGRKYKISVEKTSGFAFSLSLGDFWR